MTDKYQVKLHLPDGRSATLEKVILWGQKVLQDFVENIGPGGDPVPNHAAALEGDGKAIDFNETNHSVSISEYSAVAELAAAAQDKIKVSDEGVDTANFKSGTAAGDAFDVIKDQVAQLDSELRKAKPVRPAPTKERPDPPLELPREVELGLMQHVSQAVGKSYDAVVKADKQIQDEADKIRKSTPTVPTSGGGGNPAPVSSPSPVSAGYPMAPAGPPRLSAVRPTPSGKDWEREEWLKLSLDDRAREVYDYLRRRHNLTHNEATAILGNIFEESKFDFGSVNPREGAIGLIQWRDERDDRLNSHMGARANTWQGQIDYLIEIESQVYEKDAWKTFKEQAAISPEKGAAAFDRYYERSSGESRGARMSHARRYSDFLTYSPTTRDSPASRDVSVLL